MRWLKLRLYQFWCVFWHGHEWAGRELDMQLTLPGYRNPWLTFCQRCGWPRIFEDDEG